MRALRLVFGLLVVALLGGVGVLPAHADGRIGYSRDGRTFAPSLAAPLFDPDLTWVPGETRRATVWIRNQSADLADLVVRFDADPELAALVADDVLRVSAIVSDDRRELVRDGDTVTRVRLGADEAAEVELVLSFVGAATNRTQRTVGGFSLAVSLTQSAEVEGTNDSLGPGDGTPPAGAGPGAGSGSGVGSGDLDDDGGWLAGTGGAALGVLVAAVAALAVGTGLVGRGRRRR